MLYGSVDQEMMGQEEQNHLLPRREPSTAESRKLRKRVSMQQRALRVASRRQVMAQGGEGEIQPIMTSLFQKKKSKRNSVAKPIAIEAMEDVIPSVGKRRSLHPKRKSGSTMPPSSSQPEKEAPKQGQKHRRSWLYVLLHPHSRHPHSIWYKWFISVIILVDVAFFVASTEKSWNQAKPDLFYYEEGLVSFIFLLEYFCRLYVAPESHKYKHTPPWRARLQYMGTLNALVDAASAIPFFLELPTGFNLPNLTWIRFFRLLRILKTGSYTRSMETVWRVIYYNSEILYVALNMCIILVLVTAVLMYYLRPREDDAEQFNSLMATMYLSTLMLTGQGGPDGDLPWYTKVVVLLTGFFSVAMFAIPASMLTWGFEAEAERCAKKARQKYVDSLRKSNQDESDGDDEEEDNRSTYSHYISSSSSSEGGDTTDEEYLAIIAGGDDGGDDNNNNSGKKGQPEDEVVKQLIRTFQTSDVDASGSLSIDEFVELMTDPSLASLSLVGMAASVGLLSKRVHHLEEELAESHRKLDQILLAVQKHDEG